MKKKVAIRKLNRTLLKKEGTKEVYITGKNELMSFFGYDSIDQLATSRSDEKSKYLFSVRGEHGEHLPDLTLSVTKENKEVRLTGFGNFFADNNINEVDQIILECTQTQNSKTYLLSFFRNNKSRVFQTYSASDSLDNYNVERNSKGSIQFIERNEPYVTHDNTYWLWDDTFDENRWGELLETDLIATYINRGKVEKKVIRIIDTHNRINKLLKAKSSSSNQVEIQEKELYEIKELSNGAWINANFNGVKNIELVDEDSRLVLTNREARSFCYYEGGKS